MLGGVAGVVVGSVLTNGLSQLLHGPGLLGGHGGLCGGPQGGGPGGFGGGPGTGGPGF